MKFRTTDRKVNIGVIGSDDNSDIQTQQNAFNGITADD
jgi:hypothetical protein